MKNLNKRCRQHWARREDEMKNNLTDRKLRILEFIIQEYIHTAEPIGSRTISKNQGLNVSAATIRNEMSDLEELGLLVQPHTSAGRIPSEKAYEIYVKNMMGSNFLEEYDKQMIQSKLGKNIAKISTLLQESLDLISELTNYTSIGILETQNRKRVLKNISLVPIDSRRIVIVTVLDDGEVRNDTMILHQIIDAESLRLISDAINESLVGKCYEDISESLFPYIKSKISEYTVALDDIFSFLEEKIHHPNDSFQLVFHGMTNIFNHPEFNDISRARSFFTMMKEEDLLKKVLDIRGIEKDNINIVIGDDRMDSVMRDCSIITANYIKDGVPIGKVGIIGPKRMDYQRAYSVMSYLQKQINRLLNDS